MIFKEIECNEEFDGGRVFAMGASEAYWTLSEITGETYKEFPDDPVKAYRALMESMRAFVEARFDFQISVGEAEYLEGKIYEAYEEHKKKLQPLPTLPSTTGSTLKGSVNGGGDGSLTLSPENLQKLNSSIGLNKEN